MSPRLRGNQNVFFNDHDCFGWMGATVHMLNVGCFYFDDCCMVAKCAKFETKSDPSNQLGW